MSKKITAENIVTLLVYCKMGATAFKNATNVAKISYKRIAHCTPFVKTLRFIANLVSIFPPQVVNAGKKFDK